MDGKHVKTSGPMFDGRADRAVQDFVRDFAERYADDVSREVQNRFLQSFKKPTGRYESRIRGRRVGVGRSEVDGAVVPYAAWLEGTSPRNRRSRFKGYGSFRLTAQKMDRKAQTVANAEFRMKYLRRLNGGL